MNNTSSTPIVILAFSNDRDRYLDTIVKERQGITNALREANDRRYIQVEKEENTSIRTVFDLCTRYPNRVAIFHYGGHADGTQLQLEAEGGKAQMANAIGLAQLLGQQQSLQLVFLNGCATRQQVQALFACGVKAVIATAVPIDDEDATLFAEQFYKALASGADILNAFQSAKSLAATLRGSAREVGEFRGVSWAGKTESVAAAMPWGLYVNEDANGAGALAWTLPTVAEHQVIIRGAALSAKAGAPMNAELTKLLVEEMGRHGKDVVQLANAKNEDDEPIERYIRDEIIDGFPRPVGQQLRKLYLAKANDNDRLRQLVVTYEIIVEFFCFAVLSQLWNALIANPSLPLSDECRAALKSFLSLDAERKATFDYPGLIQSVLKTFQDNAIPPFLEEFATLGDVMQQQTFADAHRFMEQMRAELLGKVGAEEIESFCVQTEKHLGTVMTAFAFLVKYKLSSIKDIKFIKERNKAPVYSHRVLMLTKALSDTQDQDQELGTYADSRSVILLKTTIKKVQDGLNVSPFVIDENALTGDLSSKLFFYSHHDAAMDSYHFRFVSDPTDPKNGLEVTADNYPSVKLQFEQFKDAMPRP